MKWYSKYLSFWGWFGRFNKFEVSQVSIILYDMFSHRKLFTHSPYPFAAKSSQGIWWEDLLQTTSVRFHRSNKLTEFFGIPNGDTLDKPVFVFGKRGQEFNNSTAEWNHFSTSSRQEFESWMWDRIKVEVIFVNQHNHSVEIYWIHGRSADEKAVLQPGEEWSSITMLSHEWWIRDARTDTRHDSPRRSSLSVNNRIAHWTITSDEHQQRLIIPLTTCMDLSGHCSFWHRHGECHKNPRFMEEQCVKTCDLCSQTPPDPPQESHEGNRHDEF